MPINLQDAVDDLYRLTVTERKSTSTKRLWVLGQYCIDQLDQRGLSGAMPEQVIPGAGRPKDWDVGWKYDGKFRLGISLKSLLKNLAGTVPNRIDDLMGEAANVQLLSPEIVCGYVMIFNVAEDQESKKHGTTWAERLRVTIASLSERKPPTWTIGTVEASVLLAVDFSRGADIISGTELFPAFFDTLVEQVKFRNPNALPIPMPEDAGPKPMPEELSPP